MHQISFHGRTNTRIIGRHQLLASKRGGERWKKGFRHWNTSHSSDSDVMWQLSIHLTPHQKARHWLEKMPDPQGGITSKRYDFIKSKYILSFSFIQKILPFLLILLLLFLAPIIPNSFFPIMFDLGVDSSVSSMIHRMLLASTSTCTEGHPCFKCQPFLMQPTTISHDKPKTV